jgi:hypothetical protein
VARISAAGGVRSIRGVPGPSLRRSARYTVATWLGSFEMVLSQSELASRPASRAGSAPVGDSLCTTTHRVVTIRYSHHGKTVA